MTDLAKDGVRVIVRLATIDCAVEQEDSWNE